MLSTIGPSAARAAAAIPASLLMVFVGLLWMLGLACGAQRRAYVMVISAQAMQTASAMFHGVSSNKDPDEGSRKELR